MSILRGAFLAFLTAAFLALAIGFYGFAKTVHETRAPDPAPEADAIVALTGGSLERLQKGVDLLAEGRGRRLLISGVNPKVTNAELAALLGGEDELFACCIDVGRFAEDTLGNAAETAAWAQRNSFRKIILVTDDYHMPRSLTELRIALPDATFVAYPVPTKVSRPGSWQRDAGAAGRLGIEYLKYLAIRAREVLRALDESPPRAPEAGA
jgi:uncharacterized SAM-binding protein YcdF (DUF218 family)